MGVIVVLVGLFFTVGKPVINLNSSITTLNVKLEHMQTDAAIESSRTEESHSRIDKHLEKHDDEIANHDKRIGLLEHDAKGKE